MHYRTTESNAFVDVLDGFTHLPFLSDMRSFIPGKELQPDTLPILLHEYTHHLHLKSPFGLLTAYLNGAVFIHEVISYC
jgi:hypothetical protein